MHLLPLRWWHYSPPFKYYVRVRLRYAALCHNICVCLHMYTIFTFQGSDSHVGRGVTVLIGLTGWTSKKHMIVSSLVHEAMTWSEWSKQEITCLLAHSLARSQTFIYPRKTHKTSSSIPITSHIQLKWESIYWTSQLWFLLLRTKRR